MNLDDITFDSLAKMFDQRVANKLFVSPEAFLWFKKWGQHIAKKEEYPENIQKVGRLSHRAGSIPIIVDKKMVKGDWKLVATDGSIMEEGNMLSESLPS